MVAVFYTLFYIQTGTAAELSASKLAKILIFSILAILGNTKTLIYEQSPFKILVYSNKIKQKLC